MVWQFIKENKLVQRFKAHPLYLLFAPIFVWVMSNFLTIPTITALAVVLLGYIVLVILLEVWIKSKICRWMSDIWCYRIIYSGLLIICILIALPFWNTLVYACDRDNPYKQPLRTGKANVDIVLSSNEAINMKSVRVWGNWGPLVLEKEQDRFLLMDLSLTSIRFEQIDSNQIRLMGTLGLIARDKAIERPIFCLAEAERALIHFGNLPKESNVIEGVIIYTLNNFVRIEIPIPPQKITDETVIIPEIQKYFKKGN